METAKSLIGARAYIKETQTEVEILGLFQTERYTLGNVSYAPTIRAWVVGCDGMMGVFRVNELVLHSATIIDDERRDAFLQRCKKAYAEDE